MTVNASGGDAAPAALDETVRVRVDGAPAVTLGGTNAPVTPVGRSWT
jgi:hypothetical protein